MSKLLIFRLAMCVLVSNYHLYLSMIKIIIEFIKWFYFMGKPEEVCGTNDLYVVHKRLLIQRYLDARPKNSPLVMNKPQACVIVILRNKKGSWNRPRCLSWHQLKLKQQSYVIFLCIAICDEFAFLNICSYQLCMHICSVLRTNKSSFIVCFLKVNAKVTTAYWHWLPLYRIQIHL